MLTVVCKARVLTAALVLAAAQSCLAAPETQAPGNAELVRLFQADEQDAVVSFFGRVRDRAGDMVEASMNYLGVPYKRGGTSAESGFDCSGFTRYVFENSLGRLLPRRADEQARDKSLLPVARDELQPGDLVFFNTLRRTFSHVGIYVGEGRFIHAPRSGAEVRVENMRVSYWAKRYTGARRVPDLHDNASR